MNAAILTNEFPPEIYGGAGIHVKFLTQELAKLCHVEARCFGVQDEDKDNIRALGFSRKLGLNPHDDRFQKIFKPLDINLQWAAALDNVDVIHCHTWYSHFGGVLASRLLQCPLILTTHSLEPHRPWKAEQLGDGGYAMSCWIERTAYEAADGVIAVSQGMKRDVMKLYGVPEDRVKVMFIPCYLDGADGIFDLHYYDLLLGLDLTVYPSYYEPWGYTPLESCAFHVPTITTSLAGYGEWAARQKEQGGVVVIDRNDSNFGEVTERIADALFRFSHLNAEETEKARKAAAAVAKKADWKHFFKYYREAYSIALTKAAARNSKPKKTTNRKTK